MSNILSKIDDDYQDLKEILGQKIKEAETIGDQDSVTRLKKELIESDPFWVGRGPLNRPCLVIRN